MADIVPPSPPAIDPNVQAMWDALGILGFDLDGQPTPAATLVSGEQSFREYFLRCIHEERRDHDAATTELCPDPGAHDDEEFCPTCCAGLDSSEHVGRCGA